jgi:periodic tryptophan protein 1
MISAIQWIRKGAAAQQPKKYNLNDEEYERISKLAAEQLEDAKQDLEEASAVDKSMTVEYVSLDVYERTILIHV